MALQMPVYREISAIESKVFLGMSWRQLLAAVLLAVVGGGTFFPLWLLAGWPTSAAMYVVFPPCVPIAMWGWWRPKGLKPEKYLKYVARHMLGRNLWFLDGPAGPFRVSARTTKEG